MSTQHEHIVKSFDEELARLKGEILRMGSLASEQLEQAVRALATGDQALAERVVAADERIDALELEVSTDAMRVLALRQPMASDLRTVLASLRIAAIIERIGDYASNIAKRAMSMSDPHPKSPVQGLVEMSEYAVEMLAEVFEAYERGDAASAMKVRESDLELDNRYNALFRELLTYMMEDPRSITLCTHFLFIAKNIERIGDLATAVAENVWFQVEGDILGSHRPKGDRTPYIAAD
jgi:phosphate transport system protein